MTCIVDYRTKADFKAAVAERPSRVRVFDPSIFAPYEGPLYLHPQLRGRDNPRFITVTNHPKRSWFAQVRLMMSGHLKVS